MKSTMLKLESESGSLETALLPKKLYCCGAAYCI